MYSFQTYSKTPLMLSMLGGIVGDDEVQRAMSEYTKTWAFKHPSPWDYIFFMNQALKQDLDWFWYYWLWTTESVDGSIADVTTAGTQDDRHRAAGRPDAVAGGAARCSSRDGRAPAIKPMANAKMWTSNDRALVTWPVDVWFNGSRTFQAALDFGGRAITKITLDPGCRFPDRDPTDNVWPKPAATGARRGHAGGRARRRLRDAVGDRSPTNSPRCTSHAGTAARVNPGGRFCVEGIAMLKDLRHAARMLMHVKGWTAVVVLSLGLGIGANAALFSAVNGMLLTKVPVRDPDTLVRLRWIGKNDMVTSSSDYGSIDRAKYGGRNVRTTFSYPMYQQFVADNQTMTDLAAFAPFGRVNAVVDDQAELATAFVSSGNYYQMLGVNARLGRTIVPDDDKATAPPVAVISSKYWHSRFGTDPAVVGKTIKINGVLVTIVGVLPPDFTGVQKPIDEAPEISVPIALQPQLELPIRMSPDGPFRRHGWRSQPTGGCRSWAG